MKKRIALIVSALLIVTIFAGCGADKPLEDARILEANGFTASYHQYMWTQLNLNETENMTETTFSHTGSNAFFAIVRISPETAQVQGLTTPESLETLLKTYVTNYAGTKEKITSDDNDKEYVRELSFSYHDAEVNEEFVYLAKLVLDKENSELMIVLAAHPKKSDNLLKNEIELILDSAEMTEMVAL